MANWLARAWPAPLNRKSSGLRVPPVVLICACGTVEGMTPVTGRPAALRMGVVVCVVIPLETVVDTFCAWAIVWVAREEPPYLKVCADEAEPSTPAQLIP